MERFEGNGAECMVRFIEAGKKGRIVCTETGTTPVTEAEGGYKMSLSRDWLFKPCVYCTLEPVWVEVEFWKAYRAMHQGKQVNVTSKAQNGYSAFNIGKDNSCWRNPEYFNFTVQEDERGFVGGLDD